MSARDRLTPFWPLFGLELITPRLRLAPLSDDDLADLIEVVNAGVHEPDLMPFLLPWTRESPAERARNSLKHWWSTRAAITADAWGLAFGVHFGGRLVGVQHVEAKKFATVRHVETGSWIGLAEHGKGIGTEMRAAVLQFAFDTLGAQSASSGAFVDNAKSLRVSAKLGYQPNGVGWHDREGRRTEELHLLVTPETFVRPDWTLEVNGFEACKAQLGL